MLTRAEVRALGNRIFSPGFDWDPFSWARGKHSGSDAALNPAEQEAIRLRDAGKKFDKGAWRSA